MNECEKECLWGIIPAFIIGAIISFIGWAIICLLAGGTITILIGPGGIAITASCGFMGIVILVGAALVAIGWVIFCIMNCADGRNARGVVKPPSSTLPQNIKVIVDQGKKITCEEAKRILNAAQRELEEAIQQRDAQREVVERWKRKIRNARRAVQTAIAAVAATSIWNPIALAIAVAALFTASARLAYLKTASISDRVLLEALEARVVSAQAAVDIAQATVDALCGSDDESTNSTSPVIPESPGIDFSVPGVGGFTTGKND